MAAKRKTKTAPKTKKISKTSPKVKKSITAKKQPSIATNFFSILRFGESYTSLVLGIIVVVIITILFLSFFNNRQGNKPGEEPTPTIVSVETLNISPGEKPTIEPATEKTYTVVEGDTLWGIAEKNYGSGYNWVDIAKANKLANPSQIFAGNKLVLPFVKLKDATVITGENEAVVSRTMRVVENTYTVVRGDDLWNIAVRSYGDGYQWTKIAQANNLSNPNIIHAGNVLKIPRN